MVNLGRRRLTKKPSDICLDKDKPHEKVPIIVPPGIKVKVYPGISREDYCSGSNFYHRKQTRMF